MPDRIEKGPRNRAFNSYLIAGSAVAAGAERLTLVESTAHINWNVSPAAMDTKYAHDGVIRPPLDSILFFLAVLAISTSFLRAHIQMLEREEFVDTISSVDGRHHLWANKRNWYQS